MTDMNSVITPKSDQLNADTLIGGPRIITISDVSISPGTEQPVTVRYDGDEGKPWKPCKSMSRVLVHAWGPDAKLYAGRSVELYLDPTVKWGGMAVGGVRISRMSHIERDLVMALTATKGKKAMVTVKPLVIEQQAPAKGRQTAEEWAAEHIAAVEVAESVEALDSLQRGAEKALGKLATGKPDLHTQVMTAYATKLDTLNIPDADDGEVIDADGVVVEDKA